MLSEFSLVFIPCPYKYDEKNYKLLRLIILQYTFSISKNLINENIDFINLIELGKFDKLLINLITFYSTIYDKKTKNNYRLKYISQ